jgi:hypothetical protein
MSGAGTTWKTYTVDEAESRLVTGSTRSPRRVRVERNIYRRSTGVLDVGFRDASGAQRWRTVDGGLMAARKVRDELLALRGRGATVAPASRLRFGEAADSWLNGPVLDLRPSTQAGYRNAVDDTSSICGLGSPGAGSMASRRTILPPLSGNCVMLARAKRRSQ